MTTVTDGVKALTSEIRMLLANRKARNGRERFTYASADESRAAAQADRAAFELLPRVLEGFETARLIIDSLEARPQPEGVEELVERLRRIAGEPWFSGGNVSKTCAEAADMIEALARLGGVGDGQK